jgi:hypothetical protein
MTPSIFVKLKKISYPWKGYVETTYFVINRSTTLRQRVRLGFAVVSLSAQKVQQLRFVSTKCIAVYQ